MKPQIKRLLLQLIKRNGNIEIIRKQGYEYSQINMLFDQLQNEGFTCFLDGKVALTELGEKYLSDAARENRFKGGSRWVEPQNHYWRDKISENDLHFPHKKTLPASGNRLVQPRCTD